MLQKSDWWPRGQPEPDGAGKGSQPRIILKSGLLYSLSLPGHCPVCGAAQASHLQGPSMSRSTAFSPLLRDATAAGRVSCRGSLSHETLGGGRLRGESGGLGSQIPGFWSQLYHLLVM